MKIIISGGTELGILFAKTLVADNDLRVIETSPKAIEQLEQLDLQIIRGNPTGTSVLQEAQVADADIFIACAHSDEVNVISCLAVKQLGIAKTFCFVNKSHYFQTFAGELGEKLAIDKIIWPEMYLGEYIAQILTVPGAIDVKFFENEDLKLLEFRVKTSEHGVGKMLKDLNIPKGVLVVSLVRGEEVIIPSGLTTLHRNDKIIFVGHESAMRKIENRFKTGNNKNMNVVIIGGGKVGYILGKALEPFTNIRVRIIEKSPVQAQFLAENLSERILILNADGADPAFLKTLQLNECDCLVALTGNDERNFYVSMHAKSLEAKKIITRAHFSESIDFFEKMGVDVALSSQLNAIQSVTKQISKDSIDLFTVVEKGKAEIRETTVPSDFPPSKLMDLKLPEGIIIAAIKRGGHTIVPCGQDKIKSGDHLRVFSATDKTDVITEFLKEIIRNSANEKETGDKQ
ncbi:MAG: Trk system potassium transporter TrkA [Candidatus Ozemobacteraceae bacterium]